MTERPVPVRDLRLLPKADLHLHLEGSARLETMLDLADRYGVSLTREHLRTFADFSEFEARYVLAVGLIRTPADLERICRELVQDAARQGVGYLEPMVGPFTYCDVFGWPADAIFDLMTGCFSAESRAQGVDIGIMVGLIRGWDDKHRLVLDGTYPVGNAERPVELARYAAITSANAAHPCSACSRVGASESAPAGWRGAPAGAGQLSNRDSKLRPAGGAWRLHACRVTAVSQTRGTRRTQEDTKGHDEFGD